MFQRNKLSAAVVASLSLTAAPSAFGVIEEVVVTATKRAESAQDIPIAVSALGEEALDQAGIANFSDYVLQLPGITAGGGGPGQNTIYIRGVASTTPNISVAGVAGIAPNVAFYLDEQPLAQPGRNLDVYAADLQRIEVLSGPQGTLFGASSQAGNVRLITNKPDPDATYGDIKLDGNWIQDGETSNKIEGMLNLPITDNLALRGVAFFDAQGGWVDNVQGGRNARASARFRPETTVRSNGLPVSEFRAGLQEEAGMGDGTADNPGLYKQDSSCTGDETVSTSATTEVLFKCATNENLAEDDFNDVTYSGGRLSALLHISDEWTAHLSHTRQKMNADGVFFSDPEVGDYEIHRFVEDSVDDEFDNTAWTVEGRIGVLDVLYTGAFTDRSTEHFLDYSDYLFIAQYLPYYICDGSVAYPAYNEAPNVGVALGTCQAPVQLVDALNELEVTTHELRFHTNPDHAVRGTFGAFFSDTELTERNDFTYLGSIEAHGFDVSDGDCQTGRVGSGYPCNYSFTAETGRGYTADAENPFPEAVLFRNDIRRTDEQLGIFGELEWDISDAFNLRVGARYYEVTVDMEGGANSSFCNLGGIDENAFGTDVSDQYDGDGSITARHSCSEIDSAAGETWTDRRTFRVADLDDPSKDVPGAIAGALLAPDAAESEGIIGKVSLSWNVTEDVLLYLTWSEGFRPGLLNRPGGRTADFNDDGTVDYTVPFELQTDELTNYEFGWKTYLAGGQVRLNGSLFFLDIAKLQTTVYDPNITNLFFSDNAADAEVLGLEGDVLWQPDNIPGLSVAGAFSFLESEVVKVITPTGDVRKGDELAYAPAFQGNVRLRYEWPINGVQAHVMPSIAYSAEAFNDLTLPNRDKIDSWVMGNVTAGISTDTWLAELYVDNITDEQAELARDYINDRPRVVLAQPRTVGLRLSYDF